MFSHISSPFVRSYGDTFLPSGNDYDFLYYELIREAKTLQAVQQLVDK